MFSFHPAQGEHTAIKDSPPEDDTALSYQRGSVRHPAHEMYPMCHHCPKNSTYEECAHKRTLKRCDDGLSNICYTKSTKRGNIVHYNMGCANHKQCQRARAKPCKSNKADHVIYVININNYITLIPVCFLFFVCLFVCLFCFVLKFAKIQTKLVKFLEQHFRYCGQGTFQMCTKLPYQNIWGFLLSFTSWRDYSQLFLNIFNLPVIK